MGAVDPGDIHAAPGEIEHQARVAGGLAWQGHHDAGTPVRIGFTEQCVACLHQPLFPTEEIRLPRHQLAMDSRQG
ncbi:hypothetical protein D3C87_1747930 [compost metagenome]